MRLAAALGCVATVSLTAAACGGSTSGTGNSTAYCNAARHFQQAANAAVSNREQIKTAFLAFDQVAAAAPSQIQSSTQTLKSAYHKVLAAIGTTNLNQDPQALTNAANTVQGQVNQLQSAGQQVTDYTKRTCRIDLSGSSGSTTTAKP
jgi:hypothetical protein